MTFSGEDFNKQIEQDQAAARKIQILEELKLIDEKVEDDSYKRDLEQQEIDLEDEIQRLKTELATLEGGTSDKPVSKIPPKDEEGMLPIDRERAEAVREEKNKKVEEKREVEKKLKQLTPEYKDNLLLELADVNKKLSEK